MINKYHKLYNVLSDMTARKCGTNENVRGPRHRIYSNSYKKWHDLLGVYIPVFLMKNASYTYPEQHTSFVQSKLQPKFQNFYTSSVYTN